MKITMDIPDEYAKPFLDEIKMMLKRIDVDLDIKEVKDENIRPKS